MHRYNVVYTNYNGEKKNKDIYFHLTKLECRNFDTKLKGGLLGELERVMDEKDAKGLIDLISFVILESYGERSADGEEFLKSETIKQRFSCSSIYEQMMDDFVKHPEKIGDFLMNIVPKQKKEEISDQERIEMLKARVEELEKANA